MPLKEGQEVLIKNPGTLVGKVIRARAGDAEEPEEQMIYFVEIEPRYYRRSNLEPVEERSSPCLERYSPEWNKELERFNEAGRQYFADPHNKSLLATWVESGAKLGIFVPI